MDEYVIVPRELLDRVLDPITSEGYLIAKHEICALMANSAEVLLGEPVAWMNTATGAITAHPVQVMDWDDESEPVQALYTHPAPADPGEVERLRDKLTKINELIFATGAPLGGDVYFQIREICAEELRYEVRHV